MEVAKRINEYYTYSDYCTWEEDERWELIDGVPYAMAPAPSLGHQDVSGELFHQIRSFLESNPCRVFIAPVDVRLNADDADDTVVQPDILVVCDESKFEKNGKGIIGAPDFIAEVISPSTAIRDWVVKRELYEKYGVKEYWIIDLRNSLLVVNILEDGKYVSKSYKEEDTTTTIPIEVLEGCMIDLSKVFDRVV